MLMRGHCSIIDKKIRSLFLMVLKKVDIIGKLSGVHSSGRWNSGLERLKSILCRSQQGSQSFKLCGLFLCQIFWIILNFFLPLDNYCKKFVEIHSACTALLWFYEDWEERLGVLKSGTGLCTARIQRTILHEGVFKFMYYPNTLNSA